MFIFPGLGLGSVLAQASEVTDGMVNAALKSLADHVTEADISLGRIYPAVASIRSISHSIAVSVIRKAKEEGVSTLAIADADLEQYVRESMYSPPMMSAL